MIGIVSGEDWTAIEFRPIFASSSMKWATICINKPLPDKCWGEWGFAFTRRGDICVFKGDEMSYKRPFNLIRRLFT